MSILTIDGTSFDWPSGFVCSFAFGLVNLVSPELEDKGLFQATKGPGPHGCWAEKSYRRQIWCLQYAQRVFFSRQIKRNQELIEIQWVQSRFRISLRDMRTPRTPPRDRGTGLFTWEDG